ncbi:MAG: diguanylate cyclase [Zoogloeaceae bacterium]|nr:diguanylate cyclase [Zoogloeaceae bacterium]
MRKPGEIKLQTIKDLELIADAHLRWIHGYNRTLVCGDPPSPEIMAADAHHTCEFGRWYQSLDPASVKPLAGQLKYLGDTHRAMHESAAAIAGEAASGRIDAKRYDGFSDHAYRFKTGIRALQMKLIREVCLIDHLTGVWNRSSLIQRISEEHERMLRHGGSCCLAMMDIDHFKTVNDRFGHAVGDQVLQAATRTVRQRLRRYDAVFRYGGEEFLICLPRASMTEAVTLVERIRTDIAAEVVRTEDGTAIVITASFGVAELSPTLPIQNCIEAADQALLRAKAAGRNQTCCP